MPYLIYKNPNRRRIFLWYENEKSISQKAALARLFGVDGLSIWRLGNIPLYDGYNIIESIK